MKIVAKIAVLMVALMLAGAMCMARAQSKSALVQILRQQGFSGALTGDFHFAPLGTLHCAESNLRVVYFEWYGPAHPGSHRAQYRVIFLEGGNRYVGSLVIGGDIPVSVKHNLVLFDYDQASGNAITCAEIGPGKQVLLDGGWETFFK
jgi:hypothetical protein